ncbi:nucleoporin NUP188-like isoform X2 [Mytilus edulis]|uniref:nucleoporin NUP188-like isoform X2 n=1 Tax=Mytilus edulis TaxID=6550 RepID=UPI0039F0973B
MAGQLKSESFGNRYLWQLINGTGFLRPNEYVKRELKKNEDKISKGLLFFRKPVTVAGDVLKEKKLSKVHHDFLIKLSSFLGLDEEGSYELFNSFLASDYRGSQKNLQSLLSNDRHCQSLIYKVRDYYFTERLYLLQCIKVVINFWQDDAHPYKDEFQQIMEVLNTDGLLFKKIDEQLKWVLDENLPTWENHSVLMTDRQALIWAHQNLKEQSELLEIFLIYLKDFEISVDQLIELIETFRRHGFGRRQSYKHILRETAEQFIRKIGYLEVLILLEAVDLETLHVCSQLGSFDDHFILKDEDLYKKVDKIVTSMGSEPCHGPILLCWATIRLLYGDKSDLNITRKLGNLAIQLRVFDVLFNLLNTEPFNGKTTYVCSVAQFVLYNLFVNVMSAFEESTLGRDREIEMLHKDLCQILKLEYCVEDFWQKGLDEGLGTVFQSAKLRFPLDFTTMVLFSTSLSEANEDSAKRIYETWKNLLRYTEPLDRNYAADLMATKDPAIWKLARNKFPFSGKDFKIDAGTYGQILQDSGKPEEGPIIQWEVTYDGWELLICEIEDLLNQASNGTGNVPLSLVSKVTLITQFVKAMISSYPAVIDELMQITECLYQVIHRFSRFTPVPLDLISSCIDCLKCVAKIHPKQVWHSMKQTGLLPYLTGNVDNYAEVVSGQEVSAGSYGQLLAGTELIQGHYPVTCSLLDLMSNLIQPFFEHEIEGELMAPVLYILREVFPVFQKWRYVVPTKREQIGHSCLEIFHKILTFLTKKPKTVLKRPQLQQVCVYSLLFTEAGRALLEIIGTGSDTVEYALAQQGSIINEGTGTEIIKLIQMSFSVLNRLLLLKSPDLLVSPMENALSSQPAGRQTQHIVATIAQYIYHRHNPRLPTLACLLLKRLAMVSRMSILACLGGEAEAIRDMYLTRLQAVTEDLRLKVVILELLSVCVEEQPGLIEMFLNVQPSTPASNTLGADSKTKKKDLSLGKTSCLLTVHNLMEAKKQGKYYCPPDLLCACLDFIHSLWAGMRETAMAVLRERETFWLSVCAPLTRDIPNGSEYQPVLPYQIKTISFVMKVLAQELYSVTSSKLDVRLKKVLKDVSQADRFKYWSEYLKDCLITESERETKEENLSESPTLQLLMGWKNFLITVSKCNIAEVQLTQGLKELIIVDLLEGLQALVAESYTELKIKLSQNISALLFTLIKLWTSCLTNRMRMIKELESVITQMLSNSKTLIPTIQLGILGAITAILQYNRDNKTINLGVNSAVAVAILPSMCTLLLQSCRELPPPGDLTNKSDDKENMSDVRIKLQIVACCLIQEILLQCERSEIWLPIIQEHMVLSTLLSSMEMYIRARQALSYVHAAFLLLLTIAKNEKGAESVVMSGLVQHTCLSVMLLYQKETEFFPKTLSVGKPKESMAGTEDKCQWHTVLCVCLDLYATILGLLKYSFLEDSLNFVGAHQDRMQECLERSRITMTDAAMLEAEKTCAFINLLSKFNREWRLHLGESLVKLQTSMMYMTQTFIAFLMRPRYLQQVLEQQNGQTSRPRFTASPVLQQQSSTEDIDKPSKQLVHIQHRMLDVLSHSLSSLKKFTPDLCEILHEQNMDYSEFDPFLALAFSGPSPDQDSIPSFGTLTSCIRDVCVKLLMKEVRSPHKNSNSEEGSPEIIPKNLIHYVMENALYIVMSQATRYLRDPHLPSSEKQLLKRELGTEMNYFLMELQRYLRRGTPSSPSAAKSPRPALSTTTPMLGRSLSQSSFASTPETEFFKFVQEFVIQVLK